MQRKLKRKLSEVFNCSACKLYPQFLVCVLKNGLNNGHSHKNTIVNLLIAKVKRAEHKIF